MRDVIIGSGLINRPTARLIGALLLDASARGDDQQATEDAIQLLTGALYSAPYGRDRRWAALAGLAPQVAGLLRDAGIDVRWIHPADRRQIRAVRRQVDQANAWIDRHGTLPRICVAVGAVPTEWPPHGSWQRSVWEVANFFRMDSIDRNTSGIPLPRDVREGLAAVEA